MDVLMVALKIIIMIIVPVATSIITYFGKKCADALISRIDNTNTQEALNSAVGLIINSVNCIQQTYVDNLKKADKFTPEAQMEALDMAKQKAIELMNTTMIDAITKNYGDIDQYVSTIIESIIANNKK